MAWNPKYKIKFDEQTGKPSGKTGYVQKEWEVIIKEEDYGIDIVEFNGSTGLATVPHNTDLVFGDGSNDSPFSISAWVNMDDASNFPVFAKGDVGADLEYRLITDGSDLLSFILYDGTG